MRYLALAVAATLSLSAPLAAQDTSAQPVSKSIYLHSGTSEFRGQLLRLGPDTLTLLVGSGDREFKLADVTKIEVAGDSVKNGAIIGAVVLGAWCALICPQGLDGYHDNQFGYILAVNTLLGAAVGAGIDGMHVGRTTVYQADGAATPRRPSGRKVSLALGLKF